jgi:hypothetical protein
MNVLLLQSNDEIDHISGCFKLKRRCSVALFVRGDNTGSKATDCVLETGIWFPEVIFSVYHANWLWSPPAFCPNGTGICPQE